MHCPYCNHMLITKQGNRQTKIGQKQLYRCKSCKKYFSEHFTRFKHYPTRTIIASISTYNKGYTLTQTTKLINKKFKTSLPLSTLANWVKAYSNVLTLSHLRKKLKLDPETVICQKLFSHSQPYLFQYQKPKLMLTKQQKLISYIRYITTYTINVGDLKRCSQSARTYKKQHITKEHKNTNESKIAKIALDIIRTNTERHLLIQNIMLIKDKSTIATELPIYNNKYLGHIDILQYSQPYFTILDYKPTINKIAYNQVKLYKYLFCTRLNILFKNVKTAVFNEQSYVEVL